MLRFLNRTEEAVICLLLVLTTLLVFVDVIMRFGFNTGFMWTQELTLHMSAWFVLFGASYGIKVGSHIGVDAFVKLFPRTWRRLLSAIGCLLSLIYCGLVLYGSWIYLGKVKRIGIELEDLPIPAWIAHGMLIVGFTFLSLRIFILLWDIITNKADGFRHADEAKESMELVEELKGEGAEL
ncbi:MAG TPA: TRAP transporter small permease [Desulfobulbaceae bacterium]|nr:TRAP transporter small permease [Desulfobulbaceae bacterium]